MIGVWSRPGWLISTLAAASVALGTQAPSPAETRTGLSIVHVARQVAPGEVVLITITASTPLSSVDGHAFGRLLAIFAGESANVWRALIGIDLGAAAGTYSVSITAKAADGVAMSGTHRLSVAPRTFGVRRLRVPEQFVTPPPNSAERIKREQARLAEVFAAVSGTRLWHGAFESPTDGAPVSNFGVRSDYNGKQGTPHRGTDFAGAMGAPVRAPNAGRVVLAADLYFSGQTVILDHGLGLFSLLAHLSRIDVHEGEMVAAGARVGAIGASGRVTGPHLHWSVRVGPASVDPISLLTVTRGGASGR
jgi:murein DD-endopeptidase MepM/ murein hydrolase activator NlpD